MHSPAMRSLVCIPFLAISLFAKQTPSTQAAPQAVQRDAQAIALIQQSIAAMGGQPPTDSTATGAVTIVAGSETDHGTVRILSRGTQQTLETVTTSAHTTTEVYSAGVATEVVDNVIRPLSLERAATTQCIDFPLPFVAALLSSSDETLRFIGSEQVGAVSALHLQALNTYASRPGLGYLSNFSVIDVWLDASSFLPLKVAYVQREGGGAAPKMQMEVLFSQFQTQNGVSYPLVIQKKLNGVLWMTINIQSIAFNSGLSDADFPVEVLQ